MRNRYVILLLMIALLIALSACLGSAESRLPDEKKIESDLIDRRIPYYDYEEISQVKIVKRSTEIENKHDIVWGEVKSKSEEAAWTRYYVFEYRLYDVGG